MRHLLALTIALGGLGAARAAEPPWTVERLSREGWAIAGFTGASDIRASLILFRKEGQNFLVQCSTFYDVTRSSRVTLNCYELR